MGKKCEDAVSKPKVLLVIRPVAGGMRGHLRTLVQGLHESFVFYVACTKEQLADFADLPCELIEIPLYGHIHPYYDMMSVLKIAGIVRRRHIDIVHAHGFKAALVGRLAARLCRVPAMVTVHTDFAHAETSYFAKSIIKLERRMVRLTVAFVAVSNWLALRLSETLGLEHAQVTVIPNGIELEKFRHAPLLLLPGTQGLVIGTVARLAPQKGLEVLLQAVAIVVKELPQVRFVLAGDGPLRSRLIALVKELDIEEQIDFLGYCENVPGLLKELDLFVLPSLNEAQGIAVLEAMAAGCPVVATNVGGLRELIQDQQNGLLVNPGDPEALAGAILSLAQDREKASALATQAQDDVRKFDLAAVLGQTKSLYQRVLESRAGCEI